MEDSTDSIEIPVDTLTPFRKLARSVIRNKNRKYDEDIGPFLLCYKALAPPGFPLFEIWTKCFEETKNDESIVSFLHTWLTRYPEDFSKEQTGNILSLISSFHPKSENEFKMLILKGHRREDKRLPLYNLGPSPNLSLKNLLFENLGFPISTVAYELTRIEMDLFLAITPRELVNQGWQVGGDRLGGSKGKKGEDSELSLSPNITRLINRFNEVSYWVSTEILMKSSVEAAAFTIKQFIQLGKEFRKLHNYNGCMEVLSGLNNASVRRLTKVWKLVPDEAIGRFQTLETLVDNRQNFKNYRENFSKIRGKPKIPLVSILLRDLTFAHVGSSTIIGETPQVNREKLQTLESLVRDVQQMQKDCLEFEGRKKEYGDRVRSLFIQLPHTVDNDILDALSARFDNCENGLVIPPMTSEILSGEISRSPRQTTPTIARKEQSLEILFLGDRQKRYLIERPTLSQHREEYQIPTHLNRERKISILAFYLNNRVSITITQDTSLPQFLQTVAKSHRVHRPYGFVYQTPRGTRMEVSNEIDFIEFRLHVFFNPSRHRIRIWFLTQGMEEM